MNRSGRSFAWVIAGMFALVAFGLAPAHAANDQCEDPYPCGGEWPPGMEGPFDLAEVRKVTVASHDGVVLDGWIASPTVPEGVRTPTILQTSPYFDSVNVGQVFVYDKDPGYQGVPDIDEGWWSDGPAAVGNQGHSPGFPPIRLIRRGYTLAYFSVRGTGSSGGCFEFGGKNEQLDQKVLVDWLAAQSWSNGRVGITGLSYMSWTAWQAAVQAPSALKAIMTAGDVTDFYQMNYSPQGARSTYSNPFLSQYELEIGLYAGVLSGQTDFVGRETCPHGALATQEVGSLATGDRNAPYWEERNLSRRLSSVKAAVLDTGGYYDVGAHPFQDSAVWGSLDPRTPKVQFRGWWGHAFPHHQNAWATTLDLPSGNTDWETVVTRWFDYWLKGIGPAPRTGVVYHQDQNLRWHEGSSWSPEPSKKEVLYLSDTGLEPSAREGNTSFRSAPPLLDHSWGEHAVSDGYGLGVVPHSEGTQYSLCPDVLGADLASAYLTPPATEDTLIAGNPFVYLTLSSDMPSGLVTASLYDIGPDFACTGALHSDARYIASGSADLNFIDSPFLSRPFPVNAPTDVRIDLTDVTYSLAPGHRLAVTLSHGEILERTGTSVFPNITIHGGNPGSGYNASHIVLPVAEGTFGGLGPSTNYPQRPFTPPGYRD
jgi:predicted acyl esterase